MGQSLSGLVQTPVLELREELDGLSCSTQTREGFVGFLQAQVSLDLRLADGMSLKTHLEVIDAESTYDILLGMDLGSLDGARYGTRSSLEARKSI